MSLRIVLSLSLLSLITLPAAAQQPSAAPKGLDKVKNPQHRALLLRSMTADATLDAKGFGELYTPDATFSIGAIPTVSGRGAIEGFVTQFFKSGNFTGIDHEVLEAWEQPDTLIISAVATFKLTNGVRLAIPYAKIVQYKNGLAQRDRIYIDTAPLSPPKS